MLHAGVSAWGHSGICRGLPRIAPQARQSHSDRLFLCGGILSLPALKGRLWASYGQKRRAQICVLLHNLWVENDFFHCNKLSTSVFCKGANLTPPLLPGSGIRPDLDRFQMTAMPNEVSPVLGWGISIRVSSYRPHFWGRNFVLNERL